MSHCVWGQRGVQGSAKELLYPSTSSVVNQNDAFTTAAASSAASAAATPQVLCMSWNHDGSCLAVGTVDGFRIYSTEYVSGSDAAKFMSPAAAGISSSSSTSTSSRASGSDLNHHRLVEVANRNVPGGVRHIAIHEQGSVVLFSGASAATENIVVLWDDAAGEVDGGGNLPIQQQQQQQPPHTPNSNHAASAAAGDDDDDGEEERGPLFRRTQTDEDVQNSCVIGRLVLAAPVAGLRLHDRLVVVAEPFRVHLYDTYLVHLDTLLTPNHGKRSASFSEKGDLGLVWDNGAQSIAIAAITGFEMMTGTPTTTGSIHTSLMTSSIGSNNGGVGAGGTGIPVVRVLTLGPTVGSVRCLHYYSSPTNTFAGGNRLPPSLSTAASIHSGGATSRTPTSLGSSAMPTMLSAAGGSRWLESKLVGPSPHSHRVQCLAISPDGTLGLSCSVQGTAIKLIDTKRAVLLKQFTRGITTSVIGCLTLSVDGRLAACIGKSGTVHVFSCNASNNSAGAPGASNGRSGNGSSSASHANVRAGSAGSNNSAAATAAPVDGGSFGGGFSSIFKTVLQGVAQVGALDSLQAYLGSDYALTTFNLNIANADSDGLRLRSSLSPADPGTTSSSTGSNNNNKNSTKEKRSAISEAFILQDEDNLQRVLDVSEHSGFDPLFTALQFRPGFHNLRSSSSASGATASASSAASPPAAASASSSLCYANLFLACGNVTPDGYGLKSKCIQVAVPLPSSLFFNGSNHQQTPMSSSTQNPTTIEPPFVTHTSLFPKDSL